MPAHPYPEPDERYTLVQLEDGQYLTYDGGELVPAGLQRRWECGDDAEENEPGERCCSTSIIDRFCTTSLGSRTGDAAGDSRSLRG
eukprot:COSAG04_NODE_4447_length_2086_cov_6.825629_1_plen_86_part_00